MQHAYVPWILVNSSHCNSAQSLNCVTKIWFFAVKLPFLELLIVLHLVFSSFIIVCDKKGQKNGKAPLKTAEQLLPGMWIYCLHILLPAPRTWNVIAFFRTASISLNCVPLIQCMTSYGVDVYILHTTVN